MENGNIANGVAGPGDGNFIRITLKTLDEQRYPLQVNAEVPIRRLKEAFARVTGMCPQHQRLIYNGARLRDEERSLASYNVQDGHTLHLIHHLQPNAPLPNQPADPPAVENNAERHYHFQILVSGNLALVNEITSLLIASSSANPSRRAQDNPTDMQPLFYELSRISGALFGNEGAPRPAPPMGPTRLRLASLLRRTSSLLTNIAHTSSELARSIEEQSSDPIMYEQRIGTSSRTFQAELSGVPTLLETLSSVQAIALSAYPPATQNHPSRPGTSSRPGPSSSTPVSGAGPSHADPTHPSDSETAEDPATRRSNRPRDPRSRPSCPEPGSKRRRGG